MIKRDEKNQMGSCFNKAAEDEPLFVLRAQDMTAPHVVQDWLDRNPQIGMTKRLEAMECIEAMFQWKNRKMSD